MVFMMLKVYWRKQTPVSWVRNFNSFNIPGRQISDRVFNFGPKNSKMTVLKEAGRFFGRYWKSITWSLLIAYLLFIPGNDLPHNKFLDSIPHLDKIVHFVLFTVFTFLLYFEKKIANKVIRTVDHIQLILIAATYGACTEIIQGLMIFERTGSWFDYLTDLIAIASGTLIFLAFQKSIDRFFLRTP